MKDLRNYSKTNCKPHPASNIVEGPGAELAYLNTRPVNDKKRFNAWQKKQNKTKNLAK